MRLKAPSRLRDVLHLLAQLGDDVDLPELLQQVDWAEVTPRQIYLACFGRLPEASHYSIPGDRYSAANHMAQALHADEFQNDIVKKVLKAYPEKRRLLFIHIPKCAGTNLKELFGSTLPWLYEEMASSGWTSRDRLLLLLKRFAIRAIAADTIFVSGHTPLAHYLDQGLYRFEDRIFTIVRHPLEIMISQANYIIRRFFENPTLQDPDTREWADVLGINSFDITIGSEALQSFAHQILNDPQIVSGKYLCYFLGRGTAASAIELMSCCDVEITTISQYRMWLRKFWNVDSVPHSNVSKAVVTLKELDCASRERLWNRCFEDRILYDRIIAKMEQKSGICLSGPDLI